MEYVIGALVVVIVALLLTRSLLTSVIVYDYQRGLRFHNGRFVGLAEPGRHWLWRPTQEVRVVDTRESVLPIPGQEVVTSDGVSVKLTLGVRYRIADPVVAHTRVQDYHGAAYLLLQVALREVVAAMTIDEVLERRESIGPEVEERCLAGMQQLGLELVSVHVKDLMFPGPLRKVFAQVTEARQQGLASLEKARGETAALRSLANAARMIDANPSLLQLRTLQQLASSSGNTLIIGMPQSSTPVPVRQPSADAQLPGAEQGEPSEA